MGIIKIDQPYSEYLRVSIRLESAYKVGHGWTDKDREVFENEVYPELRESGFIIEPGKFSGSACSLHSESPKTDIYMHPMEYSGYATQYDIDLLLCTLENVSCCKVLEVKTWPVYDLTDKEYSWILMENKAKICRWIKDYLMTHTTAINIGTDYVTENRIPRVGDTVGCISSEDIDCHFIEMMKEAVKFKVLRIVDNAIVGAKTFDTLKAAKDYLRAREKDGVGGSIFCTYTSDQEVDESE